MSRWLIRWLCLGYALGFVALEVARVAPIGYHWIVGILVIGWLWLFLPLPILAVLALARREALGALALLLPAALFVAHFGPMLVPRPSVAYAQDESVLRIVTANLYNTDQPSFLAVVRRDAPDVVVLQEMTTDMASRLQRELLAEFPHQILEGRNDTRGMGIISRYPLALVQPARMDSGQCSCQAARADTPLGPVLLINVHPRPQVDGSFQQGRLYLPQTLNRRDQEQAFAQIRALVEQTTIPVVVAGDFNATDRQPHFIALQGNLRDAFREGGFGFGLTWPHLPVTIAGRDVLITPLIRIDYVLADPRFTVLRSWKGRTPESDHDHVLADLRLRN